MAIEELKSRALPPASNPSDKTDEEAAVDAAATKYNIVTMPFYSPQTIGLAQVAHASGYVLGAARIRALVGKEIGELKFRWENTKAYQVTLEARIQEIERRERESIADNIRMSAKIADQDKLLELAEKALEEIECMSVASEERQRHRGIFRDWKDIAREAFAALKAGRGK